MNCYSPAFASHAMSMSMGMPSPLQQQALQASSDVLPSISPSIVYSTAHAAWTSQEMQIFHQGLADYPADKYDNVTRYIKVAALLPGKCVRDVAFRVKALSLSYSDDSDAAAMGGRRENQFTNKRMKIVPYQDSSSKFTFPTAAPTTTTAVTAMFSGSDDPEDAQLSALLQDNVLLMNAIRANLLSGKFDDNLDPMGKFRDNCNTVLGTLGEICNSIPPLPIKLDTSLLSGGAAHTNDQQHNL